MKNNKIKNLVFIFATVLFLTSCFNDDDLGDLEFYTDAYVITKMVDDEPGHAVTFFAYGNQMLNSATVTQIGGSGEKINLAISATSIFVLTKQPAESDFRPFVPATSKYSFTVTTVNGATVTGSDEINPIGLEIPVIGKTEFSDNSKLLDISWNTVEGVDGYVVKIVNSTGANIYNSVGLEPTVTGHTINILLGNGTIPVESGENYTIQVHAFAYENGTDELYAVYNMEEIAIGEKNIIWP